MPVYLAYQFEPKELTQERLVQIMDDHFDFEILNNKDMKKGDDYLRFIEKEIKVYKKVSSYSSETKRILSNAKKHPFGKLSVAWLGKQFSVKNHPLLEIIFRYEDNHGFNAPENFSGLSIWPGHSGSAGLVEMLEFKPEMDSYLSTAGIKYYDRSKLTL